MNGSDFNFYRDIIKPNMLMLVFMFVILVIGFGSVYFLGRNNPIELAVEEVIAEETGLKVDLTPSLQK